MCFRECSDQCEFDLIGSVTYVPGRSFFLFRFQPREHIRQGFGAAMDERFDQRNAVFVEGLDDHLRVQISSEDNGRSLVCRLPFDVFG